MHITVKNSYYRSFYRRYFISLGCREVSKVRLFDKELKARSRDHFLKVEGSDSFDYLREEAANRLVDRLDDITRNFPLALDIGCHRGHIARNMNLRNSDCDSKVGGIEMLVEADISKIAVDICRSDEILKRSSFSRSSIVMDEENMPFNDNSFDLIMSSMYIHWINDLPNFLRKVLKVLKPDGAFVASMLGGTTLQELRYSFYLAEQERKGGISPHASPLAMPSDIAALMQAAGFTLPTIDIDTITVEYPNALVLLEHIQSMGEGHATYTRQINAGKDTMLAMAAVYQSLYGQPNGSVTATFQLISVIGWCPHESQPKPKKRGSQQKSLKELGTI